MTRNIALKTLAMLFLTGTSFAETYRVGPDHPYTIVSDVPWESLAAGDSVLIHWRPEPYHDKWVICVRGTEEKPVIVSGIAGPDGERPIIDGSNAVTRDTLNYWNEPRGIVKSVARTYPKTSCRPTSRSRT